MIVKLMIMMMTVYSWLVFTMLVKCQRAPSLPSNHNKITIIIVSMMLMMMMMMMRVVRDGVPLVQCQGATLRQ